MADRYVVTRLWTKYKGRVYKVGELLPETFTHHDRFRSMYPSRIGVVHIEEAPKVITGINVGIIPGVDSVHKEIPDTTNCSSNGVVEGNMSEEEKTQLNTSFSEQIETSTHEEENNKAGKSPLTGSTSRAIKTDGVKPLSATTSTGAITGKGVRAK